MHQRDWMRGKFDGSLSRPWTFSKVQNTKIYQWSIIRYTYTYKTRSTTPLRTMESKTRKRACVKFDWQISSIYFIVLLLYSYLRESVPVRFKSQRRIMFLEIALSLGLPISIIRLYENNMHDPTWRATETEETLINHKRFLVTYSARRARTVILPSRSKTIYI